MFLKKDFILFVGIILVAILAMLLILPTWTKNGEKICIMIDGTLYGEYSLSQNQTIIVNEPLGYNKIIIENGAVYMDEADCPDKYCMKYKPIKNNSETIICLPHKLVLEVKGENNVSQVDVIVP
ncbi:hypothetical protein IMSAGC011_00865 [Lachnospiraceae bacterium]|nr:hypothetical protein IMSAGC011_00865 [Lachnospiraceae bacterium]